MNMKFTEVAPGHFVWTGYFPCRALKIVAEKKLVSSFLLLVSISPHYYLNIILNRLSK